jgi:hypothetical protein
MVDLLAVIYFPSVVRRDLLAYPPKLQPTLALYTSAAGIPPQRRQLRDNGHSAESAPTAAKAEVLPYVVRQVSECT